MRVFFTKGQVMPSIIDRARADILALKPYQSARSLVSSGPETIFLDANECPYEPVAGVQGYSRYADQQPKAMVEAIARVYDLSTRNMVVTRGADEAIDLTIRAFCESGKDNVVVCPPTFPMYAHYAKLQGVEIREAPLTPEDFQIDVDAVKNAADENTKIVFLCSPNNPTANVMNNADIEELCRYYDGRALVAVDETYNAFSGAETFTAKLEKFPNLIVYRTLSKEYACAGVRCGLAAAQGEVIEVIRRVLAPYPIPVPVSQAMERILRPENVARLEARQTEILATKARFVDELRSVQGVEKIYPGDANFIMAKFENAAAIVKRCRENGIILRDQSYQKNLENCVRIAIGSDEEMDILLAVLRGETIERKTGARTAALTRNTKETEIDLKINLDANAPVRIHTGIGFYDHMLEQIARHGGFSLVLNCEGDLEVDPHHTVEDCAIALGQALKQALGDKAGIGRYGFSMPMDESLADVTLDLSGRYHLSFEGQFPDRMVGEFPVEMTRHVFASLCENLQATCHMRVTGENTHHMIEACFKGFARALRQSIHKQGEEMPSTKGVL